MYEIHMVIGECTKTAQCPDVQAVADKLTQWHVPLDLDALRTALELGDTWAAEVTTGTPRTVSVRSL